MTIENSSERFIIEMLCIFGEHSNEVRFICERRMS